MRNYFTKKFFFLLPIIWMMTYQSYLSSEDQIQTKLIRDGATVFDIGTNVGNWARTTLNTHSNLNFFAFEPQQKCHTQIEKLKNYESTGHSITLQNHCFSDTSRSVTFYELRGQPGISAYSGLFVGSAFRVDPALDYQTFSVETTTVDEYCSKNNIKHIDFLNIDASGSEYLIIQGAKKLLLSHAIDYIQFDYGSSFVDSGSSLEAVVNFLKSLGYTTFKSSAGNLTRVDFDLIKKNTTHHDVNMQNLYWQTEVFTPSKFIAFVTKKSLNSAIKTCSQVSTPSLPPQTSKKHKQKLQAKNTSLQRSKWKKN